MASSPISIRLSDELKALLKQEAERLNRSESFVAIAAISSFLRAREDKRTVIDAAVSAAEEGRFISSAAIGAWVDSWGQDDELSAPGWDTELPGK